ncbi:uncharacterized protein [Eurosta solidaginis]|uniref:uncharacterized protein n=1 Tax=Eurosta solidaginis TaxID=178769 RepID=UPI003530F9C1
MAIEADQLKALVDTAVAHALSVQRESFEQRLATINQRLNDVSISAPPIETYSEAQIVPGIKCDEPLDIVKSLPDFDDHQPLTFAVSDGNPNSKIKRWKAFIDEHNAQIFYKPGRENHVADALSRQNIHTLEEEGQSDLATVHSEISLSYTVEASEKPLNCFRNQIVLEEANLNLKRNFIYFGEKTRHVIQFINKDNLIEEIKTAVNPNVVNAIHCALPILVSIQHELIRYTATLNEMLDTNTNTLRMGTTPLTNWKLAKFESSSSPSIFTTENLEEMGIGTLDSEESSSSAASSIALVLSASADENSNGTTPNLDAPKVCHNRITSYRPMDNTLDSTLNSDMSNNTLIGSPNIDHHDAANCNTSQQSNNIKTIVCDYQNVESKGSLSQQQVQFKHGDNVLTQNDRKEAILGIGAGIASSGSLSVTTAPQVHNANSNSNSPSAGRSIRSHLATATGNNNNRSTRNASQNSQQIINTGTNATATTTNNNAHVNNGNGVGGTTNTGYMLHAPNQSTLIQQKQRDQMQSLRQHQQQSQQTSEPHIDLYDNLFFLFRQHQLSDNVSDGMDHFSNLSDEIILQIFKWLLKKALIRCSHVSRRLNRCAKDESLWTCLDLGGRHLRAGALENILTRGAQILRLAQAELTNPVFKTTDFLQVEPKFESKLQYLDLSMVSVTKPSLKMLLSRCRQLKKLSLEHVPINDEICNEIATNTNLEALNLAMCIGLEAWSVRKIMESLKNLNSLNISWTNLSVDAVTSVVTNVTPNLIRLNNAGCRKTLYDSHVTSLAKHCTQLLEIDFSDCTALTGNVINIICRFKMLEYLSLSRCYLIPASAYMDLSNLSTLTYLDIFGTLSDTAMELLGFQN